MPFPFFFLDLLPLPWRRGVVFVELCVVESGAFLGFGVVFGVASFLTKLFTHDPLLLVLWSVPPCMLRSVPSGEEMLGVDVVALPDRVTTLVRSLSFSESGDDPCWYSDTGLLTWVSLLEVGVMSCSTSSLISPSTSSVEVRAAYGLAEAKGEGMPSGN